MKIKQYEVYAYGNGNTKAVTVTAKSYEQAEVHGRLLLPGFPKYSVYLIKTIVGDHSH